MPRAGAVAGRKIAEFASALDRTDARWRKTPPVRIEWCNPPRRNTLPLLRYSVNPGKTMILKVMVIAADSEWPASISVALFRIDGRFLYDTSFNVSGAARAVAWLRRLFAEKSIVEVAEENGRWAGSSCGSPAEQHVRGLEFVPGVIRSWLGTFDAS